MKKIWVFLATIVILLGFVGSSIMPTHATSDTGISNEATVTRLEWLKALTTAFEMEVEEQNYPDNYYSDVDSTSEDYYDIMLATEFGLVDVEAGGELCPDDPATREFAAHTLNLCMGYFPDEEAEYTFSEADSVTYPDDIQIAINKGWIELSGDDFLPNQGITATEKDKMIAAAEAVVASTVIDEDYEGSYELVEGVIVVPEGTEVMLTDENELTIYDCSVELKTGDVFVVFSDGFPVARKAVTVTETDDAMVVAVESVELEEAFTDLDTQGVMGVDLTQVQAVDDSVQLAYIVGGTEEQAYEDGVTFYSLDEVDEQKVTAVIATKEIVPTATMRSTYGLDPEKHISVKCKITDVKPSYDVSILEQKAYFNVSAKVTFSFNLSTGDIPLYDFENEFFRVPIGVVGYFQPTLEANVNGTFSLCSKNNVSIGVQWTAKDGTRLTTDFKKEAFTIQAKVEGNVGVKFALGVDVGFLDAQLYIEAGGKATAKVTNYTDGQSPSNCIHLTAHLYAEAGGKVTFKLILFKAEVSLEHTIMDEDNSPVKVALHYEDGKYVDACTRDGAAGDSGSSSGSSGNSGTNQYKYYTPVDSQYAYSGANTGKSSTGEIFTIFDYELDDSNQATITGYNGNVAALNIPETIDGYMVVGIGSSVFKNNTRLMMVTIPDTVTTIGNYAFAYCSNLMEVVLSENLKNIGACTFRNCDELTSIELPLSLESCQNSGAYGGTFQNCDNLKNIVFENGRTNIPAGLFSSCTGLEQIIIPDTITVIEDSAFNNCVNLRKIVIPTSVTVIGSAAFLDCNSLSEVILPDTMKEIGWSAFGNCSNLKKVHLPRVVTNIGFKAFQNCDALTSIEIPSRWENGCGGDLFFGCDSLKTVTFEEGIKEIPGYIFRGCSGLEEIIIPNTVTVIYEHAFEDCTNLKKVELSNSLTSIEYEAFVGCNSLVKLEVPNTVINIGDDAFADCSSLAELKLSTNLESLGYWAFGNCDSLTNVHIPKSLKTTGGAFHGCDYLTTVTFDDGITEIIRNLFTGCNGLEEIELPDTITTIEYEAFRECEKLKQITLPEGLKNIERYAFFNCCSLCEISIPDSVNYIGDLIFVGCTSLNKVKLPDTCKTITWQMFAECTNLSNIELPNSITTIKGYAFENTGLEAIAFPEKLEVIEDYAFNNCDSLKAITIPDSVTSIGTYCFADCEVLSDVQLGSGLTTISSYTFNLCPALTKIVLPYRVSTVNANAFTNCTSLTEVTIPRATTTIADNTFSYPTKMTVYGVSGTYAEEWAGSVGATFVNQEVPATAVTFNENTLTLNKGNTANLIMTVTPADFTDEVTWKSSNTSVATITDTGVVTAKGVGTATIRVTVGNVSASCKVTVVQPVTSISLNKTSLSLEDEGEYTLTATAYPTNANDRTVTWSSSDETVATVDQNGKVTALKKGTATITVTANDGSGIAKSCTVTVTNNHYRCNSVSEMESSHNYENNCNDVWIYKLEGAERLSVTFDAKTCVEDEFDYIYLYDADGTEIGTYTGSALSGQTLIIDGDTIEVKLSSDSAGNDWGFKVTSIEEYCEHTYATVWSSDESYHWYASTCGHSNAVKDKAEHTLSDWIIDKEATTEAAGSKHTECLVCKKVVKTETIPQLRDYVKELEDRLTAAMNQSVQAAENLTPENYAEATEEEKKQAVENVLNQISSLCIAQDIDELGILPVDTALELVNNVTAVEQRVAELLNTSVTVMAKDEQQTLALPTVQNALLSVEAGENATIKVAQVQTPTVEGENLSNAVALTLELYNAADEKMNLKAPVIVTLPIPSGLNANEKISIYHFHEGSTEYTEIIPTKVDQVNNTITFVTGSFSTFTVANVPTGVEVSGTITSFGDANTQIKVQLTDGSGNIVSETNVTGNSASYSLTEVLAGTYTMSISKAGHVTRTYAVTVSDSNVSYDAKIQLKGDVTGDGVVNARDKKMIYNHISGTSALSDYTFLVGDVTGDGVINARDKKMIYNHIAGTSSLWV